MTPEFPPNLKLTFEDAAGNAHPVTFVSTDEDFTARNTFIEIDNTDYLNGVYGKCAESCSVLDTAAGVDVKVTFADGTVLTHHASMAA